MRGKVVMFRDELEIDQGEEALTDEQPLQLAMGEVVPRRRLQRELERDKPTAAILPIYLREMGSTPLIEEARAKGHHEQVLQALAVAVEQLAQGRCVGVVGEVDRQAGLLPQQVRQRQHPLGRNSNMQT